MAQTKRDQDSWMPVSVPENEIEKFINKHSEISVVDETKRNLEELFLLRNPKYRFDKNYQGEFEKFYKIMEVGNWFYFPWLNTIVKYLPEDLHFELRTGRNKYLITSEEQSKFYNATIAF
jgi:hypothetical protein